MSNSIDPDEMAHYEQSHLDLCCLQKPIIIVYGSESVKALSRFVAEDFLKKKNDNNKKSCHLLQL